MSEIKRFRITREILADWIPKIRNLIKNEGYTRIPTGKGQTTTEDGKTIMEWVKLQITNAGYAEAAEKLTKANIKKLFQHPELKGIRPKMDVSNRRKPQYGAFEDGFDDLIEGASEDTSNDTGSENLEQREPEPQEQEDVSGIF